MNNKLLKTLVGATLIAGLGISICAKTTFADTANSKKGIRVTIEKAKVQTPGLFHSQW